MNDKGNAHRHMTSSVTVIPCLHDFAGVMDGCKLVPWSEACQPEACTSQLSLITICGSIQCCNNLRCQMLEGAVLTRPLAHLQRKESMCGAAWVQANSSRLLVQAASSRGVAIAPAP